MNKVMLSLVLTLAFSMLIVLGVGFFQIMSDLLNSNLAVLGLGFSLLYFVVYAAVSNTEEGLNELGVLDEDSEEVL